MTKDELIARLQVLGEQLNRDVSLTGTKEELVLRVAELEEELDDTDDAAGQDTSVSPENALTGHENEVVSAQPDTVTDTADLVTVVALVTLHTDALHATRDEAVAFVLPGTLDTRRGSHSELETAVKDLGKAVSYKGMYGDVAIVVYSGQYVENGVKKNFLPDNTMVLGNTQARGLRTYGCIQDADAQREGINASARYPKNWVTTGDPAREFTMIQSAPLMLLADPDEFVSVQLA
ncbi:hypothetical protein GUB62_23830 [Escherichia coli]|nr:hypothetical protein [Escherichia coli]